MRNEDDEDEDVTPAVAVLLVYFIGGLIALFVYACLVAFGYN